MKPLIRSSIWCAALLLGSLITAKANETNSISYGEIPSGSITNIAQTNFYAFTATSNDVVDITLVRTNGTGVPYFYLFDPDGNLVLGDNYNSYLAYVTGLRLTNTGTYTAEVVEKNLTLTFKYLLNLTAIAGGVNLREAGDGGEAIVPGTNTSGHLSAADMDTYTFTASSNDVVDITLVRTNGTGAPYFALYGPDAALVLANNYNSYLAYTAGLRLTKTGSYTLVLYATDNISAYDYALNLTAIAGGVNLREAGDGDEAILPGENTGGHISPADKDTYTFMASSNDVVDITLVRTNGTSAPYFALYDPNGVFVLGDNYDTNLAYVTGLRLTNAGSYTLVVNASDQASAYDYVVCMIDVPGPNSPDPGDGAYTMSANETRSGQITPGDLDAYAFHAIAGDTLTITVQKTSGTGLNPVALLHAPDGTVLATGSSTTSAVVQVSCVSETGTYVIVVYANGLNEAFGYDVTLNESPNVAASSGLIQYLAVYECDGDVWLRWETNAVGFVLESTVDLSSGNWFPVDEVPQVIADHYYLDEGVVTNRTQFFRLEYTNSAPGSFPP